MKNNRDDFKPIKKPLSRNNSKPGNFEKTQKTGKPFGTGKPAGNNFKTNKPIGNFKSNKPFKPFKTVKPVKIIKPEEITETAPDRAVARVMPEFRRGVVQRDDEVTYIEVNELVVH
jgi:hypothetical protein